LKKKEGKGVPVRSRNGESSNFWPGKNRDHLKRKGGKKGEKESFLPGSTQKRGARDPGGPAAQIFGRRKDLSSGITRKRRALRITQKDLLAGKTIRGGREVPLVPLGGGG